MREITYEELALALIDAIDEIENGELYRRCDKLLVGDK